MICILRHKRSPWYNPAGSVNAERLFSRAKFVLSDERAALEPTNIEGILFLRYNKDFWGIKEIPQLIVGSEEIN